MQRYGLWRVTTEGDVEGRSTRSLGEFKGNFDEIAFYLADKCYYTLEFDLIDETPPAEMTPTGACVNVRISGKSGEGRSSSAYSMSSEEQAQHVRAALQDTNVGVKPGNYYRSVTLNISRDDAEMKRVLAKVERAKIYKRICEKLTPEELTLVGLEK